MDLYEFENATGTTPAAYSSDATANASSANRTAVSEQPSLNDEVQQALGSLGSWWGGFRKQSTVALASARKDLGQVVQQAQKEIGKLATAPTPASPEPTTSSSLDPPTTDDGSTAPATEAKAASTSEETTTESTQPTSPTTNSLFSFLPQGLAQNLSSAPAQLQTTLQRTLATPEIQNLRSSITSNLSNIQSTVQTTVQSSVHSVQSNAQVQNLASSVQSLPASVGNMNLNRNLGAVEGFMMEKGEEFWKGAGEFFREAIKIVPPSEEELAERERMGGVGVGVFDGAGVWVFDDLGGDGGVEEEGEEGKRATAAGPASGIAVSRTAMLLKQLRGEPALLRVDPLEAGQGGTSGETYEWFLKQLEGKGVSVGSEAWLAKCAGEEGMFEELKGTKESLVPAEMDETSFWKRYWFRAWQIREAEEKRKTLLQATLQKDEEFAWEDEEEDSTANPTPLDQSSITPKVSVDIPNLGPTSAEMKGSETEGKKTGPTSSSPRESSEDSYDLVSTRSGNASGTALAPALTSVLEKKEKPKKDDDDSGDSDWE